MLYNVYMPDDLKEEKAFQALDTQKIKDEISPDIEKLAGEKAEKIATEKLEAYKKDLSARLTGESTDPNAPSWTKRGEEKPADWKEVDQRIDEKAKKIATEIITEATTKQKVDADNAYKSNQDKWRQKQTMFDSEFHALQAAGVVPEYSKEVQDKLNKGEKLSREEFDKDPGLTARREIYETAEQHGVTPSTAYKNYYKQSAGAKAPVFGAGSGFHQESKEHTYEETVAERKKIFS